jgi:hypothetical protein
MLNQIRKTTDQAGTKISNALVFPDRLDKTPNLNVGLVRSAALDTFKELSDAKILNVETRFLAADPNVAKIFQNRHPGEDVTDRVNTYAKDVMENGAFMDFFPGAPQQASNQAALQAKATGPQAAKSNPGPSPAPGKNAKASRDATGGGTQGGAHEGGRASGSGLPMNGFPSVQGSASESEAGSSAGISGAGVSAKGEHSSSSGSSPEGGQSPNGSHTGGSGPSNNTSASGGSVVTISGDGYGSAAPASPPGQEEGSERKPGPFSEDRTGASGKERQEQLAVKSRKAKPRRKRAPPRRKARPLTPTAASSSARGP